MRVQLWWAVIIFSAVLSRTAVGANDSALIAPVRPVSNTYFGTTVVDPYRWMEAADNPELKRWLAAQNIEMHRVLGRLNPSRAQLLQRIRALQRGTASVRFVDLTGDAYTWLETPPGEKRARLMRRSVTNGTPHVLLDPKTFDLKGRPASIDFYSTSTDGKRIVVAISHGGDENWSFRILDATTGKLLPEALPDIAEPFAHFSVDGTALYYSRLQPPSPGAPESTKFDGIRVYQHLLGTKTALDRAIFGAGIDPDIVLDGQVFPAASESDDGRWLIASVGRGTEMSQAYWIREKANPAARWRPIATYADRITQLVLHGDRACAIRATTSNGQIVAFDVARETAAQANVVLDGDGLIVAAESGGIASARDAFYVYGQRNGSSEIFRLTHGATASPHELDMPTTGELIEFTASAAANGIVYALQSPTLSPRVFRYEPGRDTSVDTGIYQPDPADFSAIVTRKVEIESTDGARVPVTITMRRDLELDGSHPLLLTVYGAYGSIVPMWFSAPNLAWYERGGIIAHVHARGGGEKGEAWHTDATKTNKQRTVDDVIAAARWLVREKYTAPEHLAIAGKSAGGIPVGAAIVQQPMLFRAALLRVGVVDLLRIEQTSVGPANIVEYGSVSNEDEFRALHAISAYANVRDDTAYPAVLLETGINDPRVPSWQLAKMTARLQAASSSGRPVLLRVDYAAGHGIGSNKDQIAELLADEYAFLAWQLGLPGFTPR